jgi:hypothetical protein
VTRIRRKPVRNIHSAIDAMAQAAAAIAATNGWMSQRSGL